MLSISASVRSGAIFSTSGMRRPDVVTVAESAAERVTSTMGSNWSTACRSRSPGVLGLETLITRSEERRVGKEGRSREARGEREEETPKRTTDEWAGGDAEST